MNRLFWSVAIGTLRLSYTSLNIHSKSNEQVIKMLRIKWNIFLPLKSVEYVKYNHY